MKLEKKKEEKKRGEKKKYHLQSTLLEI